ncbi:hypothetical protein [Nostoc sp.]
MLPIVIVKDLQMGALLPQNCLTEEAGEQGAGGILVSFRLPQGFESK